MKALKTRITVILASALVGAVAVGGAVASKGADDPAGHARHAKHQTKKASKSKRTKAQKRVSGATMQARRPEPGDDRGQVVQPGDDRGGHGRDDSSGHQ